MGKMRRNGRAPDSGRFKLSHLVVLSCPEPEHEAARVSCQSAVDQSAAVRTHVRAGEGRGIST